MLSELSARLSKVIEQMKLKEKLARDLSAVEAELGEITSSLEALGAQLEIEQVDVKKLERTSMTALFYTVLGSREEQLEKERQELLSAQLRYQRVKYQMEALQRERESLSREIADLAEVEDEYQSLLAEKETLLRQSDPAVTGRLLENARQSAELAAQIHEIGEAIQAGRGVLSSLNGVLDSLGSAQRWGIWDMFGGGVISTALKHDHIDNARQGIQDVQEKMSRFERELADVRNEVELQIDIGGFETFADYFFDGLISDWVVQSKIEASLKRARNAKRAISKAIHRLQNLKQELQNKQNDLQEQRAQFIERS